MSSSIYLNSVRHMFRFYKGAENIRDAYLRSVEIGDGATLLPLSFCHLESNESITKLTSWRNDNVKVFPTQFFATNESTRNWLEKGVLKNDGRILFFVIDKSGSAVGHLGFNNCLSSDNSFEIDNVVKGEKCERGLFSLAMKALLEWARTTFEINDVYLRVMEDNTHAIRFYEKLGFVEKKTIPLRKQSDEGIVSYVPVKPEEQLDPDANFIKMQLGPIEDVGQKMILTAGPSISAKEAVYAYDAAEKGWNSQWSKYLTKFEEAFAQYVGAKYALATSSCTGALQIALMSLDIGPGDEVIVPDETWVATANAVRYVGAIPVFADVELDTWNIDPDSIEKLITPATKAIMPVHMYGHPARMTRIVEIAEKYGLHIVEDAAPAIGAEWKGQRCGSFGKFAGFSFQGAKLLVTGEGGMLVTNDDDLYVKAKKIWDQGRNPSKTFWIDEDGVKFKMSNVQAAVGLGQLERADELIEMKRRVFSWYEQGLSNNPYVSLNKEVEGARSIYWMSSIRLHDDCPVTRDELIVELRNRNVDSRPVFPAISQYPIWPRKQAAQPTADLIGKTAMNLPSGVCLLREEVEYVCNQINKIMGLA